MRRPNSRVATALAVAVLMIAVIVLVTVGSTSAVLASPDSHVHSHAARFIDFTDTAADNAASWDMFDRVVILADLHGDYQKLVDVLVGSQLASYARTSQRRAGDDSAADAASPPAATDGDASAAGDADANANNAQASPKRRELNWIANRTLLVQLGDMVDRGPDDAVIMDTLMRIQAQAPHSGSRVAVILGNHEVLQIQNMYHYAHRDAADAFGGRAQRTSAMAADGKYGKWLRSLPAIVEAWDTIFVHAGLTKKVAQLGVSEINRLIWRDIDSDHKRENPYIFDDEGPIWTRLMVTRAKSGDCRLVDQCLELLDRKRIVVGHTPQRGGPQLLCADRLLAADVGLSRWMYSGTSIVELTRGDSAPREVIFSELAPGDEIAAMAAQQAAADEAEPKTETKAEAGGRQNDVIKKELLTDPSALDDGGGGVGTDCGDARPALRKRVGRREATDAEAGDHDAKTRPVGVAVGEISRPPAGLVGGIDGAHAAPTTHSV